LQVPNIDPSKSQTCSIREERFAKIKKHVVYSTFVEYGKLDREKFSAAVDAEIKEWEGVEKYNSEILDFSFSSKEDAQQDAAKLSKEEQEEEDDDDDDAVNEYLRLAGDLEAVQTA